MLFTGAESSSGPGTDGTPGFRQEQLSPRSNGFLMDMVTKTEKSRPYYPLSELPLNELSSYGKASVAILAQAFQLFVYVVFGDQR